MGTLEPAVDHPNGYHHASSVDWLLHKQKRKDEDEETETVESETGDEDEDKDSLNARVF